jgi:hypothetical protein
MWSERMGGSLTAAERPSARMRKRNEQISLLISIGIVSKVGFYNFIAGKKEKSNKDTNETIHTVVFLFDNLDSVSLCTKGNLRRTCPAYEMVA